jgi:hypothetical protein
LQYRWLLRLDDLRNQAAAMDGKVAMRPRVKIFSRCHAVQVEFQQSVLAVRPAARGEHD